MIWLPLRKTIPQRIQTSENGCTILWYSCVKGKGAVVVGGWWGIGWGGSLRFPSFISLSLSLRVSSAIYQNCLFPNDDRYFRGIRLRRPSPDRFARRHLHRLPCCLLCLLSHRNYKFIANKLCCCDKRRRKLYMEPRCGKNVRRFSVFAVDTAGRGYINTAFIFVGALGENANMLFANAEKSQKRTK